MVGKEGGSSTANKQPWVRPYRNKATFHDSHQIARSSQLSPSVRPLLSSRRSRHSTCSWSIMKCFRTPNGRSRSHCTAGSQTASLQMEIELGLLSSAERAPRDWLPDWFSYTMTETEKQIWRDYLQRNPLKWTTENSFGEEKDNFAPSSVRSERQRDKSPDPSSHGTGILSSAVNTDVEMKTDDSSSGQSSNHHDGETSSHLVGAEITGAATGGARGKRRADRNQSTRSSTGASQMLPDSTDNGENSGSVGSEDASCIIHTCKICGKAGHLCKGWSAVAYCSKEHLRHKVECKKVREANMPWKTLQTGLRSCSLRRRIAAMLTLRVSGKSRSREVYP